MPLLDHFRPPILNKGSWEGFHGMWPAIMVMDLGKSLPERYTAEPRVHLGKNFEVDIGTFVNEDDAEFNTLGVATTTAAAAWSPPAPTLTVEFDSVDEHAYEVLIFDQQRGRELVAAIELVSPANKDRPASRQAFTAKCAALLQKRVCVSLVDLVTVMRFNLYCAVLEHLGQTDPAFHPQPPSTYAVTCRSRQQATSSRFDAWAYPMVVGERLPVLPIWLDDDHAIQLDLETSYQQTCTLLRLL